MGIASLHASCALRARWKGIDGYRGVYHRAGPGGSTPSKIDAHGTAL